MEAPEESRVTINDWVADRAEDRIKDLIPAGAIDVDTRLVLTNAIYFKAAWVSPFEEGSTVERAFNLLDGGVVQTPMMTQTAGFASTRPAQLNGCRFSQRSPCQWQKRRQRA